MSTVLILGASRGIGLEFTRHYVAEGWTVFATCRTYLDKVKSTQANPGAISRGGQ